MRYTIKTGAYGQYFYDERTNRPVPLAEVKELLNKKSSKLEVTMDSPVVTVKSPTVTNDLLFTLMKRKGIKQVTLAKYLKCSHQRISELYREDKGSKWQEGELIRAYNWALYQPTKRK